MATKAFPSVPASCSVIFVIVLAYILTFVHSLTLESEVEVLSALKRSVDPNTIPPSSYLSTWDFSGDPCESTGAKFLGILCSVPEGNSSSRIISIDLDAAGYDGFLTPLIGNLTELTAIDISKNRFRGPLPENIFDLKKLTRISLSGNFLTGSIPHRVYQLKELETLDLSNNLLSGAIPSGISALRRMKHLSLAHNGFIGKIPNLNGLWQLQTLELHSNMFVGNLPTLPTRLTTLTLCHNLLSGRITSLGTLKQLRSIDVSDNRFTGPISRGIFALPLLTQMNVSFNQLTAMEVNNNHEVGSPLQVLSAQGNRLQGHLPVNLVTFERLLEINLAHNQLTGRIPREYGVRLGNPWRTLFLDHNFLSGPLPSQFSHLKIRGSLASNCLRCTTTIPFCRGGQRPGSACLGEM
ncbi:Leucine-rich repeat, typical subtype [Corchorus olitorius]|uniref:Leucine-rich repeat, typical subtype n=1 Tax=Corchorus olitorius TaxID=93759 RepID=A0A1R3JYZ1_9ROSI|nr:Leucine-rich repeat, typical subtype [Corchorus olitorius]